MPTVDQLLQRWKQRFRRNQAGASAVEYGLLAVAIAAVIVLIAFALGGLVQELFGDTCDSVQSEASTTATCG
jgi:pilus assembly protein Flp/PilA